jgi:hypothetical protein
VPLISLQRAEIALVGLVGVPAAEAWRERAISARVEREAGSGPGGVPPGRLGVRSVVRLIVPEVPDLGEPLPAPGILTPGLVVVAFLDEGLQPEGYLAPAGSGQRR